MSDIFISYASEDRGRVQSLARALERMGWSVWWDRRIPTGRSFDEVIQEALDAAKSVIVVWTKTSVKSSWVKNEARKGLRRRVLFPVMLLEEVEIPLEFEHVQAAQLMDWQPEVTHFGFDQFVQDIAQVLGSPSGAGVEQPPVKQPQKERLSETKPASTIASLPGSADHVEHKQKPSTPPTSAALPRTPPQEETQPSAGEDHQFQRYILSGIGLLLLLIGAFVAYWISKSDPPPVTSDTPPAQTTVKSQPDQSQKDGAQMVLIPTGEFWMGSPDGEGDKDEHPRHRVSLDAYSMDKFEVTVSRYAKFLQSTGRRDPDYWDQVNISKHSNLPVVGVDWHDAEAYCQWAGKRLPTEAAWEKAARGTDGRTYPWGNGQPTPRLANFNKEYVANFYDERLAPVDSYEAGNSPYRLHHMAGNVWEWTADWSGEQ